jgi:transposase-like protein
MDHACCQLITKKLHAGHHHCQICSELGVSRSVFFKIKKLQDDSQDLTPRPRGGSKRTVRTVAAIAKVQRAMAANPQRSIRQLARHHKMDPGTMRNLVKEYLGLESQVVVQRLLLTPDTQETRKERCQKLINKLKASQPHQLRIFSDEKIFTVDVAINRHNSRYLAELPVANVDPDACISPESFHLQTFFIQSFFFSITPI